MTTLEIVRMISEILGLLVLCLGGALALSFVAEWVGDWVEEHWQ